MSRAPSTPATLSPRQLQVLEGVADYLDSDQIAARLGISKHTVDGHIAEAIKKLGARSRRDAVRLAGLQPQGGEKVTGDFPPVEPGPFDRPPISPPNVVNEAPSVFIGPDITPDHHGREDQDGGSRTLWTLLLIVGIAAGVAIVLLAVPQLAENASKVANSIQPYQSPPPNRPGR